MKQKVYIETTIPSYLAGRPSRDLVIAGNQELTREWWGGRRDDFDLYVSQFVLDEAGDGMRKRRVGGWIFSTGWRNLRLTKRRCIWRKNWFPRALSLPKPQPMPRILLLRR